MHHLASTSVDFYKTTLIHKIGDARCTPFNSGEINNNLFLYFCL